MVDEKLLALINELSGRETKTLLRQALKAMEEFGELAAAILPFEGAARALDRSARGFSPESFEGGDVGKKPKLGLNPPKLPFEIHITAEEAPKEKIFEAA